MKFNKEGLIVVTGGSGFIGSSVIKCLNDQGLRDIVVVDELGNSEKWKNLVGKKIKDIIEKQNFFSWLIGKEAEIGSFIHLGACSSTVETDASYLLENNYRFSVRLAEYALKYNLRFIYASSAATYGDGSLGFFDDEDKIHELQPLNMYGFSKQLFDAWAKNEGVLDKFVGLKYFNVFGPNEGHKGRMASAVYHMVPVVQKTGSINLFKSDSENFGDGEQKRDFIYVKDAAKMTCAFLNNDKTGIFNIGSGIASSWNQLGMAIFNALKIKSKFTYIDMPQDLIGKYQNYTCADLSKTTRALGKASECMQLEDAVHDYINNHLLPNKTW
jgi:ADP-L-glycero-D-manno-heptose 6-epimerase